MQLARLVLKDPPVSLVPPDSEVKEFKAPPVSPDRLVPLALLVRLEHWAHKGPPVLPVLKELVVQEQARKGHLESPVLSVRRAQRERPASKEVLV